MRKDEIKKKFDEIVNFSGLEDFIDTPVKRYSSGMFARLGFSVAAHLDSDILVIDEVLSVGDFAFQNKCTDKMKMVLKSGKAVIFVSHNLHAVTEICGRSILIEHGKIIKDGKSQEVIKYYTDREQKLEREEENQDAIISSLSVEDKNGAGCHFHTGQKVSVAVNVTGKKKCEKLSLSIVLVDDQYYRVFQTSSEQLNRENFSLSENETKKIVFELSLHLSSGLYHLGAYINRYDNEKLYDVRFPAATIAISSEKNIRGVANLYPIVHIYSLFPT
jgi:lipopolysaccharide transport system ATP-binding protein